MQETDQELYNLYLECFPDYPIKAEWFVSLLKPETATIFREYDGDKLVGFSMIHDNSITLLCVSKDYRNQGYGSKLLEKSQEFIKQSGAQEIILGRGHYYLLQGVPLENEQAVPFFEHRGYSAAWTSVNMFLPLQGYDSETIEIPPAPANVRYKLLDEQDRPQLYEAVKKVIPGWLESYQQCTDPILIVELDEKIAGFEIVAPEGGRFIPSRDKVGSIGCVGVVPEFREHGVGMRMVLEGIKWLQKQGCASIELLYVALVDWYKKVGFQVNQRQWMGEKKL